MSVVSLGELLIDFVALESGVTVGEASGFIKAPGGAPANVVVALARLGHASAFLTQVGDDPFGHHLAQVLADEGVDVARHSLLAGGAHDAGLRLAGGGRRAQLRLLSPSRRGHADDPRRRRHGAHRRAAHFPLRLDHHDRRLLARGAAGSYRAGAGARPDALLRPQPAPGPVAGRGQRAALDAGRPRICATWSKSATRRWTSSARARWETLWRERTQLLIVTHGPGGATLYTRDERLHMPGFAVDSVDTTGAGDGFVAAILAGLLEHGDDWPASCAACCASPTRSAP